MISTPPTILIVDDDEAICELVSQGLAEYEYACDFASTANDAATKIQNRHFDIVLLDIRLPDESGIDLLKTLQTFFETTSIIIITAVNDLDTAVQAMKLGASDYVVKPFTIDKLNASINIVLKNRKRNSSISNMIRTVGDIDYGMMAANRSPSAIDAIACGVDAQVDYFDFHSKIVTKNTIDLAQRLGLPENEIKKWATERDEFYSERNKYIKSALSKLEQYPIAQVILGLARPVYDFLKSGGEQN